MKAVILLQVSIFAVLLASSLAIIKFPSIGRHGPPNREAEPDEVGWNEGRLPMPMPPFFEEGSQDTCICPMIYAPVCASNGVTYSNQCQLDCAAKYDSDITMVSEGVCKGENTITDFNDEEMYSNENDGTVNTTSSDSDNSTQGYLLGCICPTVYSPVCASNGVTYANDCEMKCNAPSGVTISNDGSCEGEVSFTKFEEENIDETEVDESIDNATCICPMIYSPVCGSDGETYGNRCMLNCQASSGVSWVHNGQCEATCICPRIYQPVCGSDGNTYANICSLECQSGVTLEHYGSCVDSTAEVSAWETVIDDIVKWIFGNGNNNAEVDEIENINDGSCVCLSQIVFPVCGIDGNTYSNTCLMDCANVALDHYGSC